MVSSYFKINDNSVNDGGDKVQVRFDLKTYGPLN